MISASSVPVPTRSQAKLVREMEVLKQAWLRGKANGTLNNAEMAVLRQKVLDIKAQYAALPVEFDPAKPRLGHLLSAGAQSGDASIWEGAFNDRKLASRNVSNTSSVMTAPATGRSVEGKADTVDVRAHA